MIKKYSDNESSINFHLDHMIAEHLDITVDEVDEMDLDVVKKLREIFKVIYGESNVKNC